MDDKGVIHIPEPDSGRAGGSAECSGFDILHKQVGFQWSNGETHDHTMYLFKIHTLKLEEGTFETELQLGDDVVDGQGDPIKFTS